MYVGRIVELTNTDSLFRQPRHPYTETLLSAAPRPDPGTKTERILVSGEVANPAAPPAGCYFHPRCRYAEEICRREQPLWKDITPAHGVACHFAGNLQLQGVD